MSLTHPASDLVQKYSDTGLFGQSLTIGGNEIIDSSGNVDIPGTLDVTGAVTLESTLMVSDALTKLRNDNTGTSVVLQLENLAAADTSNAIILQGRLNSDSAERTWLQIRATSSTITDASRETTVGFYSNNSGAFTQFLEAVGTAVEVPGELTITSGVLAVAETTTPSAVADEGRIYTKTDNKLYFQDGEGTEHEVAFV